MTDNIKAKAEDAVRAAKDKASEASKLTAEKVEGNPLIALMGGLTLGAIAAALLPRTRQENDLLGNAGTNIRGTATKAASAARDAGKDQLNTLGVTPEAAKDQFRDIAKKIGQAVTSATNAASDTIRKR
jgi:hypothetical protein